MRINFSKGLLLAFAILSVIGCDQKTKSMAKQSFMNQEVQTYFHDTFRLLYTQNEGAFLSMGSDLNSLWHLILLKIFPVIMLSILLMYTFLSKEMTYGQRIAMALILGGGISNIIDRLMYGKVIDFMNMGIGSLRTGVFNFADVFIIAGIVLFLFCNWMDYRQKKAAGEIQ